MNLYFPKPEIWQKDVIDLLEELGHQSGIFISVKSARQCGKSWMLNALLLMTALNYPGTNSALVSLTSKNTHKLFKELCDGLDGFDGVKYINKSLSEIEFKNGSTIVFRYASQGSALRGYSLKRNSLLLIDEAAFIQEHAYAEILPWSNKNKCPVILVSTPFTKNGTFYQHFIAGLQKKPGFYSIDWANYDKSAYLSEERIEQYRSLLSPGAFRSEILGEWIDDLESLFNLEQDIWYSNPPAHYDRLYIGIDWAAGNNGDYSVLTGFDNHGNQILLEYTNSKKPEAQLQWFASIINKLDPAKVTILAESNSLGAVYIDRLKTLCPRFNIQEFVTSNSSKKEIIEYLISRINSGAVKLLDINEQRTQLSSYKMEITRTGAITYNGSYGQHDDLVMANAIAFKLIKDKERRGGYNISSLNSKHKNTLKIKYS